jgi:Tfp pilus assembly protein PilV
MKNNKNNRKGFTLIENIIAFVVLTITVLGATNLLSSSVAQSQENSLRLQAYLLAQQGIESVRNVRDSNWTQNLAFNTEQGSIWGNGTIYPKTDDLSIAIEPVYDANNVNVSGAPWIILPSSSSQLYEANTRTGSKRFSHIQAGERSPFSRTITLSKNFEDLNLLSQINETENLNIDSEKIADNLILATSTVEYEFKNKTKEISLTTILTDWKEGPL